MKNDKKPTIFVIFGITGDLAHRRLLPALYNLFKDNLLHDDTTVLGVSRHDVEAEDIIKRVEKLVLERDNSCDQAALDRFRGALQMQKLHPSDPADYKKLRQRLSHIENARGVCMNQLFYLSIPPKVYSDVVENLGSHGLADSCQHGPSASSLLVEKPFGHDLKSAEKLINETNQYFDETQVYRIDHYLAKETAQNILTFRRHNPLFRGVWSSQYIKEIEVLTSEILDVKGRGEFYDEVGALRDIIQNHLMQLLTLVTFDIPEHLDESSLHEAKKLLMDEIEAVPADKIQSRVKRGQYNGYLNDVNQDSSSTETYISVELKIPTERWQGTKIRLATGKMLSRKSSLVRLTFPDRLREDCDNLLTFRLQPNEGIDVTLQVKKPGLVDDTEAAALDFDYRDPGHRDAYERVLVDAIRGDHMLFASSDEVLASWRILQPVLDAWRQSSDDLMIYQPGEDLIT